MNLTNDGLKVITADKLEYGMVIPGKLTGEAHTVTHVETEHPDSLFGTVVLFYTWNEVMEFTSVHTLRPFDRITVKQ